MKEKGLDIACEIIRRRIHAAYDIKWRSAVKKPLLPEKHVKAFLAWARENIDPDWSKLIFTNEVSFWTRAITPRMWSTCTNKIV